MSALVNVNSASISDRNDDDEPSDAELHEAEMTRSVLSLREQLAVEKCYRAEAELRADRAERQLQAIRELLVKMEAANAR
jgi:hypothetical protein